MNRFENEAEKLRENNNQVVLEKETKDKQILHNNLIYQDALKDFKQNILPKVLNDYIKAKSKTENTPLLAQKVKVAQVYDEQGRRSSEMKVVELISNSFEIFFVGEYGNNDGCRNGITEYSWFVDKNLTFYISIYGETNYSINNVFKLGNPIQINNDIRTKTLDEFCEQFTPLLYEKTSVRCWMYSHYQQMSHVNWPYYNRDRENQEFELVKSMNRDKQTIVEELDMLFTNHLLKCLTILNKHEPTSIQVSNQCKQKKEGCFIATSIYGSYDSNEVMILRKFRDQKLKRVVGGNMIISIYYFISPYFVNWTKNKKNIRKIIKFILDKMISKLMT